MSRGSARFSESPSWSDWLAYLAYAAWQAVASPVLIPRSLLRARRRGQHGIQLRRALQLPWRSQPVDLLIVGNWTGETRIAWQAAEELSGVAPRRAVLAGTRSAGSLSPRAGAMTGWAPYGSLPSALLCLARYRPKRVWLVRRNEQHHLAFWCWALGIPVQVADAFLTEEDERRVRRWRPWDRWRIRAIHSWGVPSPAQSERLRRLGVPADRIHLVGPNLGCALPSDEDLAEGRASYRARLGAGPRVRVILAGSTHPSDEPVVMDAFLNMDLPDRLLVVAPRRAERAPDVIAALGRQGLRVRRWSDSPSGPADAVVVDTTGELGRLYAAADAAFVGGSFDPRLGGHTPAEPLAAGVPVAMGPETEQQRPIVESAASLGILRVVSSAEELAESWREWLGDPSVRERCKEFARSQTGAFLRFWRAARE